MTGGSRTDPPVHTPPSPPGIGTPDRDGGPQGSDSPPRPSRPPPEDRRRRGEGAGGDKALVATGLTPDLEGRRELETESRGVNHLLDQVRAHIPGGQFAGEGGKVKVTGRGAIPFAQVGS